MNNNEEDMDMPKVYMTATLNAQAEMIENFKQFAGRSPNQSDLIIMIRLLTAAMVCPNPKEAQQEFLDHLLRHFYEMVLDTAPMIHDVLLAMPHKFESIINTKKGH